MAVGDPLPHLGQAVAVAKDLHDHKSCDKDPVIQLLLFMLWKCDVSIPFIPFQQGSGFQFSGGSFVAQPLLPSQIINQPPHASSLMLCS